MPKIPVVYELIKSLSKSEKRFLKLYSQLSVKNKNTHYMILFEILDEMPEYNKKILLSSIKQYFSSTQLYNVKKNLKQHILEALLLFNRHTNPVIEKQQTLIFANLLIERRLYVEGRKTLRILEKTLIHEEDFNLLIQVYKLYSIINNAQTKPVLDKRQEADQNNKKILKYLEIQREVYSLKKIYNDLLQIKSSIKNLTKKNKLEAEKIFNEQLLKYDEKDLQSFLGKLYFFESYNVCMYIINRNYQEIISINEKKLLLFNSSTTGPLNRKSHIFATLTTLSHCYIKTKDKNNFWRIIALLDETIEENTVYDKLDIISWKYICLLNYYSILTEENLPKKTILEVKEMINSNNTKLSQKTGLTALLALYYFKKQDFATTLSTIETILLYHNIPINDFYALPLSILHIFSHHELGDIKTANTEFNNLKRKLIRNNILEETILLIFKNISRIIKFLPNDKKPLPFIKNIIKLESEFEKTPIYKHKLNFILTWAKQKKLDLEKL